MSTALAPTAPAVPTAKPITAYRPYWAKRFGTAPFLPMSRAEMERLGWDECDVIIVSGDAYVDHPSFGMAVIGRTLEAQGFRVGIIAQPDWHSADAFKALGRPRLFFGVAAGNMDSMINHYTADRKIRSDDAYTPGGVAGKRPDRATLVYTQRCQEAYKDVPVIIGGIEASLRRIAHYDYWQDKVRRSVLVDSKADLLLYGNAERAIIEVAHRLAQRQPIEQITDVRGTAFIRRTGDPSAAGWFELDSTEVDRPGRVDEHINPYQTTSEQAQAQGSTCAKEEGGEPPAPAAVQPIKIVPRSRVVMPPRDRTVIRLPAYEQVKSDPVLYAHANRVLHLETNPGNARALVQRHGEGHTARDVWINPPPIPLSTAEMDVAPGRIVYTQWLNEAGGIEADLTVTRLAHDRYLVVTSVSSQVHDLAWLAEHIDPAAHCSVTDVTSGLPMLGLMGPASRALLAELSGEALGNEAFAFGTSRDIEIGYAVVRASRITYVGELGWELYVPAEFAVGVYEDLLRVGERFGVGRGGYYAIESMRLEKGYRAFGRELTPGENPVEAGLLFACKLKTDVDFLGRAAVERTRAEGPRKRLVSFAVDTPDPMLWGGELILRDGAVAGQVTSAAWGATTGACVGLAYLRAGVDTVVTPEWVRAGSYAVDVGGEIHPISVSLRAIYDPANERIR